MSDDLVRAYIEQDIKNLTSKELTKVYKFIRRLISENKVAPPPPKERV